MALERKNMGNLAKISKSEQFQHENQMWSRSIDFYKQENNFLKTRLSEVVDQITEKDFLALAEHFQNRFIVKDEFLDELDHDINAQDSLLKGNTIQEVHLMNDKVIKRQDKLRNEMQYLEKDFAQLKNEFNKYLATVL